MNSSPQGRFLWNWIKNPSNQSVSEIAAMSMSNEFAKQFRSLRFFDVLPALYNDSSSVTSLQQVADKIL
jgi:hypothetical protein